MISGEGALGPFIIGAEQHSSTPEGKREVEIDMEYSILVNRLNLADDSEAISISFLKVMALRDQ